MSKQRLLRTMLCAVFAWNRHEDCFSWMPCRRTAPFTLLKQKKTRAGGWLASARCGGRTHEEADEVRVDERVAREVTPGAVRAGALGLERV